MKLFGVGELFLIVLILFGGFGTVAVYSGEFEQSFLVPNHVKGKYVFGPILKGSGGQEQHYWELSHVQLQAAKMAMIKFPGCDLHAEGGRFLLLMDHEDGTQSYDYIGCDETGQWLYIGCTFEDDPVIVEGSETDKMLIEWIDKYRYGQGV